jgi:thioredoxin-dependent peroxiredoxin
MPRLEIGDQAPDFCLLDMDNEQVCLSDLKGHFSVLYFYPKDNTTGCTMEARDFTEQLDKFKEVDVPVIGISPDSTESHRNFIKKHRLEVRLLSDEDHAVLERYGVWQKKKMYGKEFMGVVRTTFILDPEGRIAAAWHKVKVPGHVDDVLKKVTQLSA